MTAETVAEMVDRLLKEHGIDPGELSPQRVMAAAINRLEGGELDDTGEGLALLVDHGIMLPKQALKMAIRHWNEAHGRGGLAGEE